MFKDKKSLRKSDIVFGILLVAVSSLFLYLSVTMPTEGLKARNRAELVYTAPGVVPSLICIVLIILGIFLIIGTLREGARLKKTDFSAVLHWCVSKESQRMWMIIGIFAVYIFVMIGRLPYMVSNFLFLTGFMVCFNAAKLWKILFISAFTTAIIVYSFGEFMGIPLP